MGDTIKFTFVAKNHTATQSSFDSPCSELIGADGHTPTGFDTGFNPIDPSNPQNKSASFLVQTLDPLWFYCRQQGHCQKGMVFAVNPPDSGNHTFAQFLAKAEGNLKNTTTMDLGYDEPTHHRNIIDILVGNDGTLTFQPPTVQAVARDQIRFNFVSKNHTVTQSSFDQPCTPQIGPDGMNITGFDTGFTPVADGSAPVQKSFVMPQTDKPLWFYCRQTGHCAKGMVFGINAPSTGKNTFSEFQKKAIRTGKNDQGGWGDGYNSTKNIIDIVVGDNGMLTFKPPTVNAVAGDEIRFNFVSKNHTATQSSFEQPCTRQVGPDGVTPTGFDSGFEFVGNSTIPIQASFIMPRTDKPLWFYCRQTGHCAKGMVFAINAPSTGSKSFAAFREEAIMTGGGSWNGTSLNNTGTNILGGALESDANNKNTQAHSDKDKDSHVVLGVVLGVIGALLVAALAFIIYRRRSSSRGVYARTAMNDIHEVDAHDFDFDQASGKGRKGIAVTGTTHQRGGSEFNVLRNKEANESMEMLKGYSDEPLEKDERGGKYGDESAYSNTYSDPYDPPSSPVAGSYMGGGR